MTVAQTAEQLKARWRRFSETAVKPAACIFCDGKTLWWNGTRVRAASVLCGDTTVYLSDVSCPRVKCGAKDCRRSWTLRPEGLTPQRHYQLDVVAEGCSGYLFTDATFDMVATQLDCSRRTVCRWTGWVGAIAEVSALLWHLLREAGQPVLVFVPRIAQLKRKARGALGEAVLRSAAGVLCVMEALAAAAGLGAPGLSTVVQTVVADRYPVTTYARPRIPDLARSNSLLLRSRSRCEL